MLKRTNIILLVVLLFFVPALCANTLAAARPTSSSFSFFVVSDKEQDGLAGPVRRVRTETAKLSLKDGKATEGQRKVLETATYDIKGNKIDNAYFLAAGGSLTGKEVYKYDEKGNIMEMTLQNEDGSLLSKEVYSYEFDAMGNWTKMTTSVAVLEGGKINYEPSEVTYRIIAYYLEDATVAKMTQAAPATPQANSNAAASNATAANTTTAPPAAVRSASPAPVVSTPTTTASVAANQPKSDAPAKAGATMLPASVTTKANKPAPVAAPELVSADKSKVYTISNPAGTSLSKASANSSSAPVVKDSGEAAPQLVMKAPVKPISGGVLNGKAINLPSPLYPATAKAARATGLVVVEVVIDVTGKVISATAVSGPVLLRQPAEAAAKQARFSPTLLSGQPVRVSGIINYNFTFSQ